MAVFVLSTKKKKSCTTRRAVANSGAGFHHTLADQFPVLRSYSWREVQAIKSTFHSTRTKRLYPSISQSLSTSQIKLPSHSSQRSTTKRYEKDKAVSKEKKKKLWNAFISKMKWIKPDIQSLQLTNEGAFFEKGFVFKGGWVGGLFTVEDSLV